MDRNVFVAIALSMSVLLFWGAFFETPKKTSEQQTNQKVEKKSKQSSIAPTINQPQIIKKIVEGLQKAGWKLEDKKESNNG